MLLGDFGVSAGHQLLGHNVSRRYIIMLISVFCILPLAMLRKVKSLWFTGSLVLCFEFFYVLATLYTVSATDTAAVPHAAVHTSIVNFFRGLPLAVYVYCSLVHFCCAYKLCSRMLL